MNKQLETLLQIPPGRERLVKEVEWFINEERYGSLLTDEFFNYIADCIYRNFPTTPD